MYLQSIIRAVGLGCLQLEWRIPPPWGFSSSTRLAQACLREGWEEFLQRERRCQGRIKPRLATVTSLTLCSISQSKSQGQTKYKGRESRVHLLIQIAAKSHFKKTWIKGKEENNYGHFFLAICHSPQFIFFNIIFIFLSLYERYRKIIGHFPGSYLIIISI